MAVSSWRWEKSTPITARPRIRALASWADTSTPSSPSRPLRAARTPASAEQSRSIQTTSDRRRPAGGSARRPAPPGRDRPSRPSHAAADRRAGRQPRLPARSSALDRGGGVGHLLDGDPSRRGAGGRSSGLPLSPCRWPRAAGPTGSGTRGSRTAGAAPPRPTAHGRLVGVDVDRNVPDQRRGLGVAADLGLGVGQALAQLRRQLVEMGEDPVEVAVGVDELGRRLLAHPRHAGQVVGRVAAQGRVLRVLRRA